MRIGLDIDDVITDMDCELLKEFLIEDKKKRNSGIIDPKARSIVHGMFDWTKEEIDEFFANNMQRIAMNMKPRRNCRKVIDKLISEGDDIILISHRVFPHYTSPYEVTEKWLEKYNIRYTKLILSKEADKTFECKENNIDVMIDDRVSKCVLMAENNINCIVMKTRYNSANKHSLPIATSWNDLYYKISNLKK